MGVDPKELRIGNWLFNPNTSKEVAVTMIDINDMDLRYKQYDPILITKEILVRCGFEYDEIEKGNKTELGMYKNILMMLPTSNSKGWYAAPYGYPMSVHRTIYLHQLQNLYFALVGEELNYNP